MLTPLAPSTYADLVGKPFETGGRGPATYDCLGLTMTVLRRNGFAIPEYASTAEELAAQHRNGLLGPCTRIETAAPGCVVLMRSAGIPAERHLGVMVDRFRMIHASQPAGAVVTEVLARSLWGRRVLGYYFPEPRA